MLLIRNGKNNTKSNRSLWLLFFYVLFGSLITFSCASGDKGSKTFVLGLSSDMHRDSVYQILQSATDQGILRPSKTFLPFEMDYDGLAAEAEISLEPQFDEEKLLSIRFQITYKGWAPWNQELQAKELILSVIPQFEREYGGRFQKIGNQAVNQNKSRTIILQIEDDKYISGEFKFQAS